MIDAKNYEELRSQVELDMTVPTKFSLYSTVGKREIEIRNERHFKVLVKKPPKDDEAYTIIVRDIPDVKKDAEQEDAKPEDSNAQEEVAKPEDSNAQEVVKVAPEVIEPPSTEGVAYHQMTEFTQDKLMPYMNHVEEILKDAPLVEKEAETYFGKQTVEGKLLNGQLTGKVKYTDDYNCEFSSYFLLGKEVGLLFMFNQEDNRTSYIEVLNGDRHGKMTVYHSEGRGIENAVHYGGDCLAFKEKVSPEEAFFAKNGNPVKALAANWR